jgi:hypothetical protein
MGSRLVLGIEPPYSPTRVVLRHPQLEVVDLGMHRIVEPTGLIVERASDDENSPP